MTITSPMSPMSPILTLEQASVSIRGRSILHDLNGSLRQGTLTAVIGPNGAGKSTLLRAMLGLQSLSAGHITCHAERRQIAYLAQQSQMERQFPMSVLDCALLGFWPASRLWRRITAGQRARACQALQDAGLGAQIRLPVGSLSVGQFQRMLFVRAQLQDAAFIVLDEPFAGVDGATTETLLQQIVQWHYEGRTVLAVLHDFQQVRQVFPDTLYLRDGHIVAWGDTQTLLPPPAHPEWSASTQRAPLAA